MSGKSFGIVMGIVGAVAVSTTAQAGNLSAQGAVKALTNINQMGPIMGTANFDEGPVDQNVPLGTYTGQGLTYFTGLLTNILAGVTTPGQAAAPYYQTNCAQYFPAPIQNGGTCTGQFTFFGGAAKFTSDITQVGLTAGRNGTQYLTVWNKNGMMIGQVTWTPANDASFIGIDTMGVPIGMVTYGNDDLWNGQAYDIGGSTIMADTWVWSVGAGCANDAACDDGDMCNGAETCVNAQCQDGAPLECGDNNDCTDDSCDPNQGCVNADNNAACEDTDLCTENTMCAEGSCGGGTPVDCADDDVCTADMCDANSGCSNAPIDGCCKSDADCQADIEVCNVDTNQCEPAGGTSTTTTTGEPETTGTSTTGETTDGVETTGTSSTGPGTTTEPETTGTTSTSTTSSTDGSASDSASGTGEQPTTGGAGTTEAPGGSSSSSSSSTGDSASGGSGIDDGGCGCRSDGGAAPFGWSLLALLGLGRRRRR